MCVRIADIFNEERRLKRKFLITNDVGLSLDKVNSVIDIIRAYNELLKYEVSIDD